MTAHQAALEALTRYFGYDSFRPGQQGIVEALLAGRDVLGVMPTGAGKSVCYQIPAALSPGVTLVISPLISLMRDQVDALNDLGLPAAFINTTQTPDEQAMVFAQAAAGQIKLLYVAPERLETGRFRDFAARTPISLIAVDEAHCVSQWGQDFRSSYLGIGDFIAGLPQRPPVGAFTATATAPEDYDLIVTGDLGLLGQQIVTDLFRQDGVDMTKNYTDCGLLLYHLEKQDMHAGGSGCGCSAAVFNGYLLRSLREGRWKRLLFAPTGALLSPTSSFQGESIPGICHAVALSAAKEGV